MMHFAYNAETISMNFFYLVSNPPEKQKVWQNEPNLSIRSTSQYRQSALNQTN